MGNEIDWRPVTGSENLTKTYPLTLSIMARKAFCVPALVTSFIAIVLLVLTTVSVPTTYHKSTPFDIVRANNLNGAIDLTSDNRDGISRARFGLWGYCTQPVNDDRFSECTNPLTNMYVAAFASSSDSANNTLLFPISALNLTVVVDSDR